MCLELDAKRQNAGRYWRDWLAGNLVLASSINATVPKIASVGS